MSEHNEKYEEEYYDSLYQLKTVLKEIVICDFSKIEKEIDKLLYMSFQQGVYSVNNQNGWSYDMEYPNE